VKKTNGTLNALRREGEWGNIGFEVKYGDTPGTAIHLILSCREYLDWLRNNQFKFHLELAEPRFIPKGVRLATLRRQAREISWQRYMESQA
jgi:hypothetical protein